MSERQAPYGATGAAPTRQVPSVGRVVHYWLGKIGPLAALVVDVAAPGDPDSRLNLVVWGKGGAEHALVGVPPRTAGDGEGWCWPPYQPPAVARNRPDAAGGEGQG